MQVLFCGSGPFGIPTLRRLTGREAPAGEHRVVGVITQPPRPAGRGAKVRPTPLSVAAGELGLAAAAAEDINAPQCVSAIAAMAADVMLVVDFGQKIGQAARSATRLGAFNLHGSLLPELRGAAPVNWAIIRGYSTTGVTAFRVVERMDAGEIFSRRQAQIGPDDTAQELHDRLAELGVEAVLETLEQLAAGQSTGQPQDESRVTRAPKLKKSDGEVDFSADAVTIRNLIHGSWPWPGGQGRYVSAEGKPADVIIARARALEGPVPPAEPGAVLDDLTIAAGAGRLQILQLKPAGRKLIGWRDFVNGYRVRPGARFTHVRR